MLVAAQKHFLGLPLNRSRLCGFIAPSLRSRVTAKLTPQREQQFDADDFGDTRLSAQP
jgi:hypothetical protein